MLNTMYFNSKQFENGEVMEFVKLLMAQSYGGSELYNDIHICACDLGAYEVQWTQIPWNHEYGGEFKYVDDDQVVMFEKYFPDGTCEYFSCEKEYDIAFSEWLKNHPSWHQTEYGCWCNDDEDLYLPEDIDFSEEDQAKVEDK